MESGIKTFNWDDIKTLIAYKVDCLTYDTDTLQVIFDDNYMVQFTEEISGWLQFQHRLSKHFPSIPFTCKIGISEITFEKKSTVLYDKLNRSSEEVLKQEYVPELNNQDLIFSVFDKAGKVE